MEARDLLILVAKQQTAVRATRTTGLLRLAAGTAAVSLMTLAAWAQAAPQGGFKAPRYQSPIEAPQPQLKLPTPPAITPNGTVVEDVIVRVNDNIIDRSDVERNELQMQEAVRAGKLSPAELPAMQRDMLRDMIDEQLLLSRGKELDINVDSAVIRQLDEIRKQNNLPTMEDLEKAVTGSGIAYEDFKADMKNRILKQEVIRNEVGRSMRRPTAKEEQTFYDAHAAEFQQPEQVRLSEILIPTAADSSDAQVAQAQAKADAVEARLKAGEKFEDVAKQASGGPTADKGGELGEFKRGALAKVLEDQTFSLPAGQWTAPIRTRQGFVVLKVTDHTAAGAPPLKDVEEQIQEAMYNEQMQPALRNYLTDLREKAYIDIAPGFVDTGASAKESKPVFSAYAPPQPKKKSVVQKQRLETARAQMLAPKPATTGAPPTTTPGTATTNPALVKVSAPGKKPKKVHKEKIRFGQAPRNALPASPQETAATAGADQGAGATSSVLPAPGAAMAAISEPTNVATNDDPLAPPAAPLRKTRYADRAPEVAAKKVQVKTTKLTEKVKALPTPETGAEKETAKVQDQPLGLNGDTASKKKKTKVKGAPKERLQDQPAAPAAPKPDATPIPPKSVRDNGEPAVTPITPVTPATDSSKPSADRTTLPPANTPAPGAIVDTAPSTPANPVPTPPQ